MTTLTITETKQMLKTLEALQEQSNALQASLDESAASWEAFFQVWPEEKPDDLLEDMAAFYCEGSMG